MNDNLSCLRDPVNGGLLDITGSEIISASGQRYPIHVGIPRFVSAETYSTDFGIQWNAFAKTQLDSHSGITLSESRLARCLSGNLCKLNSKLVLEAGSGAGRFTEVLLKYGAIVHSFDYSNAVEANSSNNGHNENLVLVQADIRAIPFPKLSYDYVICIGVLQHTPSPEESIKSLYEMVAPGGALVIDHYPFRWRLVCPPPIGASLYIYRQLVLWLPRSKRMRFVKSLVDFWFPVHWRFRNSLLAQKILKRISPVLFYYPVIELPDRKTYYEWSLLDTHDGLTDHYKHRRTIHQISKCLAALGAEDISVWRGGNGVEAFCHKPS